MMETGLGMMGMAPCNFWNMTMREFLNAVDGYLAHEEKRERQNLVRIRWLASVIAQPYSKTTLKPTDLIKFDFDDDLSATKYVDGDPTKLDDNMKKIMARWDKNERDAERRRNKNKT